ncbi:TerB N-terminal domain-containing protein [Bacillus sp. A116_S68]|nr:TerB N-terminal domain-containing protein [Bacillus sp. A116_S68]
MNQKSKAMGYLLAFFLGGIGAHLFYYKKYVRGIIYLIFCWTYIPIILGWIDMLFIKKWHEQLTSGKDDLKRLSPNDVQDNIQKEPKTMKGAKTPLFNKNNSFYNEDDVVLPKYAHLQTPEYILKSMEEVVNPKKPKHTGRIRVEISYSHSGTEFIKTSAEYRNKTQAKCQEIPLQAYWTTFENLNEKQLKWYFYWREQALKGNYIEVDLSYIFLFVYELLNYSFNPKASFNVSAMVRLYENYVDMHPKLTNYLPRWIQDMLNELGEEELASDWKWREQIPTIYKLINEEEKPLNKISITHWRPYIRNYRETKFFTDNKNKIYKVFKDGVLLLKDSYKQENKSIENIWFEIKRVRDVAHLYSGAVIGRENEAIHVYSNQVQVTDTLYDEITALFRLSENVTRLLNGEKRQIKVDEEVLPDNFKNKLLDRYSKEAKKTNERFKVVQTNDEEVKGSAIPKPLVETQKEKVEPIPGIVFNDENIQKLNEENKDLQDVFNGSEVESLRNKKGQVTKENSVIVVAEEKEVENRTPYTEATDKADTTLGSIFENTDGDEEGFIDSLSDKEKEFLSLFDEGQYSQDDAALFAKKNGKMLGLFLSELNEKANEHLGDNIVESEGDVIILYDEFTDIVQMMKGA